jgi:hypothetical protein
VNETQREMRERRGYQIGWFTGRGGGHIHRLPNRVSCIAKWPILCTFRAPELSIQTLAARAAIFRMLTSLDVWIFHCWMEYEQRMIVRFLLRDNTNAYNNFKGLQGQFIGDGQSIRSIRRWSQFMRQRSEDLHDHPRLGRPPIGLIDTAILSVFETEPFVLRTHSLRSWMFLVQQLFAICRIRME